MKRPLLLLAALAFTCLNSLASDNLPPDIAKTATGRFKVSSNPHYRNPAGAMKYLLARTGRNDRRNHFCAVGYQWPEGTTQAWVLWKEEQTLMLWRGDLYPDMRDIGLFSANRSLRLGKDTVATANDLAGSTYLVTEAWWRAVASDCRQRGEHYTIKPFKAPVQRTD